MSKQIIVAMWVGERTDKKIVEKAVQLIDGKLVDLSGIPADQVVREAVAAGATRLISSNPWKHVPQDCRNPQENSWWGRDPRGFLNEMAIGLVTDTSSSQCTCNFGWDGKPAEALPLCCGDAKWNIAQALAMSLEAAEPKPRELLTDEEVESHFQQMLEQRLAALPGEYEAQAQKQITMNNKVRQARIDNGLEV